MVGSKWQEIHGTYKSKPENIQIFAKNPILKESLSKAHPIIPGPYGTRLPNIKAVRLKLQEKKRFIDIRYKFHNLSFSKNRQKFNIGRIAQKSTPYNAGTLYNTPVQYLSDSTRIVGEDTFLRHLIKVPFQKIKKFVKNSKMNRSLRKAHPIQPGPYRTRL